MKIMFAVLLAFTSRLNVVATYPYIGDIVKHIAGEHASVAVLARGTEDPHFVVPRPSYIARARSAQLFIINGASLEIGFVPPIIRRSGNPEIQPGARGFLDLSTYVQLIEVPVSVSREMGDVHPEGNPHYWLDPHNIPRIASAVTDKLCELDSSSCTNYRTRLNNFQEQWESLLAEWDQKMKPLRGAKVIQYHKLFDYFLQAYEMEEVGTLEPKPGIPPTAKHVEELIFRAKGVRFILQDVYHEQKTARYVAEHTGARVVILPHDVGSLPEVHDIYSLFQTIVEKLTGGQQ